MTKDDKYEGNFIESADLMHEKPFTLEIESVVPPGTEYSKDEQLIDLPIIGFTNAKKRFVVNKTNQRILKAMFGPRPSEWVGKKITLTVRYLEKAFGERNVPTLRVVMPDDIPMPMAARKHYGNPKPYGRK